MKCPMCNGEGGEYQDIIWKGPGGGPFDECDYCLGEGAVSFFRWAYYKLCELSWNRSKP